ncbi:MAG: hypothetical protein J7L88_02100, partial [Thermoplasmata archaeon]|nr:hypothetical protein [Thermoplasmata archaeon]
MIFEDGECAESRGYGNQGVSVGPLTPYMGYGMEMEVLTLPAMAGRILLFTSPTTGSVGYTPMTEQSDRMTPSAIIAREIIDYPSYVKFFKPLFYLIKHEGKRAVTSLDVEDILKRGAGRWLSVVVTQDRKGAWKYIERGTNLLGGEKKVTWRPHCSTPRMIERGGNSPLKIALIDLGRNLSLERTLSRMGNLHIYPPGSVPSGDYELIVVSSGPGDPPDPKVVKFVKGVVKVWNGRAPIIATGHGALALFSSLSIPLKPHPMRGVIERIQVRGVKWDCLILHSYVPQVPGGWE